MKMKFNFLGGADIVGRMAMTIEGDNKTMLVEYGISPTKPPQYPLPVPGKIDHIFLTHSHLDHCGMVPAVCGKQNCELFTTPLSAEISELMMYDSLKIAKAEGYPEPYQAADIERTMQHVVPLTFEDTIELGHLDVTLHSAGHVPGATMFEFKGDNSTLYTGDIHTEDQKLVLGARPLDCKNLFIEGTYGGRNHPPKEDTINAFIAKIDEVIDRGGIVIVPVFAVGRTQEIMLLLKNLGYEMWVDGMGRSVTNLFLDYPEYIRNAKSLRAAKRTFNEVRNAGSRKQAVKGQIIVTTGGMLDGGPVLSYLHTLKDNPKNAILLVGYQADDTNGRMLMDQGCINLDGEVVKVACEVQKFDFSAHAGHDQIVQFIRDCDPENVIFMHSETRELFLPDLQDDYHVMLPEVNKPFELDV
ncbi:MAG: MBL fold metallo-hydrolase [Candidatus Methanomethylophilus sp.]|nr:MBL fold metallo-hydrolase [Methanomethylophilus sp.]MDD3232945.1 MBL fold metallo-hydrolase [Methanomethylophilus sp.]MDD4221662.1 MBL fold metallo-hydrolase [Methanomethylophilus sp.]MDD4668460.1 MBL fold metallo-hydrolase [Methanomethylophilus sp.]